LNRFLQVKPRPGAESTPLRLTSYWKCEQLETEVAVDYSYNGSAMSAPLPLTNIVLMAPIDGQVKQLMQSSPAATWSVTFFCIPLLCLLLLVTLTPSFVLSFHSDADWLESECRVTNGLYDIDVKDVDPWNK